MFFSYGKSLDIVQIPIVAFKNQRVDRRPLPAYFRMRGYCRTALRRGNASGVSRQPSSAICI